MNATEAHISRAQMNINRANEIIDDWQKTMNAKEFGQELTDYQRTMVRMMLHDAKCDGALQAIEGFKKELA